MDIIDSLSRMISVEMVRDLEVTFLLEEGRWSLVND